MKPEFEAFFEEKFHSDFQVRQPARAKIGPLIGPQEYKIDPPLQTADAGGVKSRIAAAS